MQYTIPSNQANNAEKTVFRALKSLLGGRYPVFLCVGTDAVAGDSLGPLTGTLLESNLRGKTYVFGTLDRLVTALDVDYRRCGRERRQRPFFGKVFARLSSRKDHFGRRGTLFRARRIRTLCRSRIIRTPVLRRKLVTT